MQDVNSSVIGSEIVDLFPPNRRPNFFTDELEHVECVSKSSSITCEGLREVVTDVIADGLESGCKESPDFGERFRVVYAGD